MNLLGKEISLFFSDETTIDTYMPAKTPNSKYFFWGNDELNRYFFNFTSNRFNNLKKVPLLPPCRIIHVSNLKPSCSNANTMWDIFSEFGIVEVTHRFLNSRP